ncbi:hypothetical protein F5B22DRAFT_640732 [Xylaria bambusicola]|uniref:uncharacterized protein n=1 Tax=Xylaria bambusicola TaxID=326684 RepID=UPI002008DD8A|nr:uncharacterized protein F5B22DRAFT_640732 [Xylaria bambusicola]KAI0527752.1 hypothetical protein F5B22DRAFT_640732 [Xylaria bambusicola]
MSSPNKPLTPPVYATNDWIISRARALINYDSYDEIERWLDNEDDEDDGCAFPEYSEDGEIREYDPDNRVLTPMNLVERLEAAATKTERYDDDEEEEWDLKNIYSSLSLSFSPGDGFPPSPGDISSHRDRAVGETGVTYASLDEMLHRPFFSMSLEPDFSAAPVQTVSTPAQLPSNDSAPQSIAVPPPAYIAPDRHRRKQYVRPRLYSYSDMDNMEKGLGIERGLSPIPRVRGHSSSRSGSPPSASTSKTSTVSSPRLHQGSDLDPFSSEISDNVDDVNTTDSVL